MLTERECDKLIHSRTSKLKAAIKQCRKHFPKNLRVSDPPLFMIYLAQHWSSYSC